MKHVSRRALLGATAIIAPLTLAGCGALRSTNILPSDKLAQALSDVRDIASGLANVLPSLGSIQGIPTAVVASAGDYVVKIQAVAGQLANVTTATDAQPFIKQLEALVNALVAAVTPFVAGIPTVGPVFAAANVLLPIVETAVGLLVPAQAPMAGGMTPDEARLILRAAAAR